MDLAGWTEEGNAMQCLMVDTQNSKQAIKQTSNDGGGDGGIGSEGVCFIRFPLLDPLLKIQYSP